MTYSPLGVCHSVFYYRDSTCIFLISMLETFVSMYLTVLRSGCNTLQQKLQIGKGNAKRQSIWGWLLLSLLLGSELTNSNRQSSMYLSLPLMIFKELTYCTLFILLFQAKPLPPNRIIVSARFLKPLKEPCTIL